MRRLHARLPQLRVPSWSAQEIWGRRSPDSPFASFLPVAQTPPWVAFAPLSRQHRRSRPQALRSRRQFVSVWFEFSVFTFRALQQHWARLERRCAHCRAPNCHNEQQKHQKPPSFRVASRRCIHQDHSDSSFRYRGSTSTCTPAYLNASTNARTSMSWQRMTWDPVQGHQQTWWNESPMKERDSLQRGQKMIASKTEDQDPENRMNQTLCLKVRKERKETGDSGANRT